MKNKIINFGLAALTAATMACENVKEEKRTDIKDNLISLTIPAHHDLDVDTMGYHVNVCNGTATMTKQMKGKTIQIKAVFQNGKRESPYIIDESSTMLLFGDTLNTTFMPKLKIMSILSDGRIRERERKVDFGSIDYKKNNIIQSAMNALGCAYHKPELERSRTEDIK